MLYLKPLFLPLGYRGESSGLDCRCHYKAGTVFSRISSACFIVLAVTKIVSLFFSVDQPKVLCRLYQKEDRGCQSYWNHFPSVTLIILFICMFASFSFVDKQNRSLVILVVIITLTLTSSKNDQLIPFHQWSFIRVDWIYLCQVFLWI